MTRADGSAAVGRPARIAWFVPAMIEGSGGIRTMLQNADALVRRGHDCDVYVDHRGDAGSGADERVRDEVRRLFGYAHPGVYAGLRLRRPCDLALATAWWTAPLVAALPPNILKAYFVQDFEAWFNPMGDGFLLAEHSYRLGLTPITIGRWLSLKLSRDFGCRPAWFEFAADHAVYRPAPDRPREDAVCFVYQPEKPRRCPRIGLRALELVRRRRPGAAVYLFGSNQRADRPGLTDLGLLDVEGCRDLYNRCAVGLCISSSNPSRVPFEMMASGLPVVDVHRETNLYDMPDDAMILAEPTPESIAHALLHVLESPGLRASMSEAGMRFMAARTLERSFDQFVDAIDDVLGGRTERWSDRLASIERTYRRDAFRSDRADAPPEADAAGCGEDQSVAAARTALAHLEGSRAWRMAQALKRTPLYRAYARARFGPGWDLVDPAEDPRQRLERISRSRIARIIQAMKRTGAYRFYARRRAAGSAEGEAP